MLTLRQAPADQALGWGSAWRSPTTVPRRWMAAGFVAFALFGAGMAIVTTNQLHRLWGLFAAAAYMLAAVAVVAWKSRGVDLALMISMGGALIAPLTIMAASGERQPEVNVISRAASLFVRHGTPYEQTAVIATTHNPNLYNPYLPVMAGFGLPRALLGHHVATDPRIWFCLAFVTLFGAALAVCGVRDIVRWTVFITATPVIAFSLAVGGTDVPVLGLLCLGLAVLWRHPRPVLAGLLLGVAGAMKATAWPALVVVAVMVGTRYGRNALARFCLTALAVMTAAILPVAIQSPGAFTDNTIAFPLGLTRVKSLAVSPLPGHLLAETGFAGRIAAITLLILAGLAIVISLAVRPPRDVPAVTWRLAIALTLMFTLAPATRFGYYMYPLGLLAWLYISRLGLHTTAGDEAQDRTGPAPPPAVPAWS